MSTEATFRNQMDRPPPTPRIPAILRATVLILLFLGASLLAADAYCPLVRGDHREATAVLLSHFRAVDCTLHLWYRTKDGQLLEHVQRATEPQMGEELTAYYIPGNPKDVRFDRSTIWMPRYSRCRWCRISGIVLMGAVIMLTVLIQCRRCLLTPAVKDD